ncbi:hypothetical protein C8J56DRAFT_294246 [Mycena floridula]|nr:hypothetical protein C8J56DRAFT_294246 [Mycena floridula]
MYLSVGKPWLETMSSSQIILGNFVTAQLSKKQREQLRTDSRIIPILVALSSVVILSLHILFVSKPVQKLIARFRAVEVSDDSPEPIPTTRPEADLVAEIRRHFKDHGGLQIFLFRASRLLAVSALLGLAITSLILEEVASADIVDIYGKWGKKHKKKKKSRGFSVIEWLHVAMCITFCYTFVLSLISVTAKRRATRRIVTRHLNTVLLAALGVYLFRDVFPLATYTKGPQDAAEGLILWAKVGLLVLASVIIPLCIPREYVPLDPRNPMEKPSSELTASIFSMAVHYYLDPLVFMAYHVPHLPFEELPPLCDRDEAGHLKTTSFKHLDVFSGAKSRHLFFGLMRIFRLEYVVLSIMILIHVAGTFASPIGINRLLHYIETEGEDAVIKPWLWISWLFFGPMIASISIQWYIFIATRTLVRAEAILTQLVFEHSLRIRVKAETADGPKGGSASSSAPVTPDSTSVIEQEGSNNTADTETLHSTEATVTVSSSSTVKGKPKDKDTEESKAGSNLVGKINNLVTTDLGNIIEARDFLFMVLYIPAQISLCIWFLYVVLGWSAFVGLSVILVMFPVPGLVAKLVQIVQERRLKKTDARVQSVTETMNVLRMIKLFGWESQIDGRIAAKRDEELVWIKRRQFLELLNGTLNFIIPVLTMVATFATYTLVMKQELNASKVFSSMSVFDMLRDQLHTVFYVLTASMTGKVSLDRMNDYLRDTELLDAFTEKPDNRLFTNEGETRSAIGFNNATFTWSNDSDGSQTPSKRRFLLKIEDELIFQKGFNVITGPTGGGKTSLLMALLGEMHFIPSSPDSWYNLPRAGGVALAVQETFVQNETIRENIIFGSQFDEERYNKVIEQCGLERDLSLWQAGDATEVGEKGLTLSGGQKARITLARACYSRAEIILLDDVLAALDVHTSKWIVENCFKGDLMRDRTVILVTHNVPLVRSMATFVVNIRDGKVHSKGSVSEIIAKDKDIAVAIQEEQAAIDKADEEVDTIAPVVDAGTKADGKLVVKEEIEEGHVSWPALKLYINGLSGNHPFFFFLAFLGGVVLCDISNTGQTWFLGYWARQYDDPDVTYVNVFYYLGVYIGLLGFAVAVYCGAYVIYMFGTIRASRSIHRNLIRSILGTTLRWLDITPTSRVIARCTQDIRAVDGPIANLLFYLTEMTISLSIKFSAVVIITPVFMIPGLLTAVLGGICGQIYIKAQLSVKREMSNMKSPVLGHFGAAIAGLTSIRAYGVEKAFRQESIRRINRYTRAARTFYNLNRWICVRIDLLGSSFACALATYLVYFQHQHASTTGFSLNMAVGFTSMLLWWVRVLNDFEVQGNSLERIQGYVEIEQEEKPTEHGKPPAYWPSSGDLKVEGLNARYSSDGPLVLKDLSFEIKSGQRIGIVGRTGSGKSSLTLSLLRCIFTEGTVYYDGIATKDINLEAIRSNITIIPQVPELLSGTLRENLDPFSQYEDKELNDALRAAGLFSLQDESDEDRIHLDTAISSGGGNLSVGQRQILALARAIVRDSKILILDEATSAIDYKTDSIIQSSLRHELKGDVTLLIVAHRLQTIMDADKIMVLDAGRIVEFDSPKELLKLKHGKLRSLVDESVDKDVLHAMADGKIVEADH